MQKSRGLEYYTKSYLRPHYDYFLEFVSLFSILHILTVNTCLLKKSTTFLENILITP